MARDQGYARLSSVKPGDVRDYLLDHPDFLIDNADILGSLAPPRRNHEPDNVQDFQHYMLTRLQEHISCISGEHNDLLELMQDHLQRQNKVNGLALSFMDASSFAELISMAVKEMAVVLEQTKVSLFLEATDAFPHGNYGDVQVVHEGFVGRWIGASRGVILEETPHASAELYGDAASSVASQALVRLTIAEGMPPGLLAMGHGDPLYYATGMPTEQVEFLGAVLERSICRWLRPTP